MFLSQDATNAERPPVGLKIAPKPLNAEFRAHFTIAAPKSDSKKKSRRFPNLPKKESPKPTKPAKSTLTTLEKENGEPKTRRQETATRPKRRKTKA